MTQQFRTSSVDLATYLLYEGIELVGFERSNVKSSIVYILFKDPLGKCIDLERTYLNSDFKKFRDMNKWILRKIHETP